MENDDALSSKTVRERTNGSSTTTAAAAAASSLPTTNLSVSHVRTAIGPSSLHVPPSAPHTVTNKSNKNSMKDKPAKMTGATGSGSPYPSSSNSTQIIYVAGKPMIYDKVQRKVYADDNIVAQALEKEQDKKMAPDVIEESQSEEVFNSYKCQSLPDVYDSHRHPGNIVEACSLSAQNLPEATYNLQASLPPGAVKEGKLSDLQLEGILFACQRHQLILPAGNRAGFFLGDGTGVGKGRQIAGIILDNLSRGRNKHIWFSVSSDLSNDAQRDLNDIGCYTKVINGCQQLDKKTKAFGLDSDYQEGIIFSTYSTLVSIHQSANSKSRLDQLVKWCGPSFEGCLIFDECHKAKHFIPGKEGKSAKVAVAVTMIQRLLPKARVVYCSATGVTDVKNMAFMERLGLWGIGTTFATFDAFLDSLNRRGLGAQEMLSMEMKAAGMYISRGLSYKDSEFETVEAKLTDEQTEIYDQAVSLWNELKASLEVAHKRVGNAVPRIWTFFWSAHQRFFKQLCMSMKVPEIVRMAKEALANDCSVVIGLQTTGEAGLDSELDQNDGNINDFVSLTKEIVKRFILQYFPTEKIASAGELSSIDEWCVRTKSTLDDLCDRIKLPNSPLDDMIDQLGGASCVSEMTGRKGFVGRYKKGDRVQYFSRGNGTSGCDSLNVIERNRFMNGEKHVAVISDASSTGISLHADLRAVNQKRRVHITAELPWSADKAVQQLGRSHRSNQSSGPIYKLVTSNLGGERRFASAVARRLQSLGAITKGDRRAATGANLTEFNFDTPYGHQALRLMYESILQKKICIGVSFEDVVKRNKLGEAYSLEEFNETLKLCLGDMCLLDTGMVGCVVSEANMRDVRKFLNRILGLKVVQQNLIFDYFCCCLDATTKSAKREGRYNDGVSDLRGNSIIMSGEPQLVFKEAQLGMSVTRLVLVLVDRGIPFDQAMEKYNANISPDNGFFRSKRDQYGKRLFLLAIQKERANHLYTVVRPNTGVSPFEEAKTDLLHKYDKIEPSVAEEGWTKEYEKTKKHCIHGRSCKYAQGCTIGSRITRVYLLTGRILSILPALELIVGMYAQSMQLSKESRNLRVVRVELDNGERIVGVRYPYDLISQVEKYLQEQKVNQPHLMGSLSTVTETEASVNKKALAKALTKPPTIKTFFSSATSTNDGEESVTSVKSGKKNEAKQTKCKTTAKIPSSVPGKKRKQSNIFNMIVSQNEKKKQKKHRTCPVCRKSFEEEEDDLIKAHIDNCLID